MRTLDEQEKQIVVHLVRDPRASDNAVAEATGINVRTVNRKRRRLEQEGLLSYYTELDLSPFGAHQYNSRHLYTIKFRIGVTYKRILEEIRAANNLPPTFSRIIHDSHIAEIDGKVALLLYIDGTGAAEVVNTVHEQLIPVLWKMHGSDVIEEITSCRILAPVRVMRNYLPLVNMEEGFIRPDWPLEQVWVGE
jgi:DNA-binding Lrp family transcriptional regulator